MIHATNPLIAFLFANIVFFSCDSLIAWEICTGVVAPLVAGKTLLATLCRCADTCAIVNMCRCADCGPYCEQVQMCNCAIFCIVRLIIITSGNLLLTFEAGSSGQRWKQGGVGWHRLVGDHWWARRGNWYCDSIRLLEVTVIFLLFRSYFLF